MKFQKKLQHQLDNTLPDWKGAFLSYKALKKRLKSKDSAKDTFDTTFGSAVPMTFLTAAIQDVDENASIVDDLLDPVISEELSDGDDREMEVGQKRKSEDRFLFEEQKKRKYEGASEGSEEPRDCLVEGQCDSDNYPEGQETSVSAGQEQVGSPNRHLTEEDENFLRLVKSELHKFNAFFLEKEEVFLIRLSILEGKAKALKEKRIQSDSGICDSSTYEELIVLHRQIVTLHGEMVLLMNYSTLNYVGVVKILKKYDKHSKSNLRQLVHSSVLQQPFFSITNLKGMVARSLACEGSLQFILPTPGDVVEPMGAGLARDVAGNAISQSEPIPHQIRVALQSMQEIQ